ncbi:MAG: zinc ribbon domain-containing protein [Bacteroidales bacterium]|nr:zinc ribbon domain-containing protein [Bacteroidales bacterium]
MTNKCPACGAMIGPMTLKCPECGYVLSSETENSREIRDSIQNLHSRLAAERNPHKKAAIINSFSLPATEEGLVNLLVEAFSSFEHSNGFEDEVVSSAWLEKSKQAYRLLKLKANSDRGVLSKVEEYSFLEDKKSTLKVKISKSGKRKRNLLRWIIVLGVFVLCVYLFLIVLSNMDEPSSDSTIRQEVMELIENKKYDEARKKAMELEYSWDQKELMEMIDKVQNE